MTTQNNDNALLINLAKTDQSDRVLIKLGEISLAVLKQRDETRLTQVEKEIELDRLHTIQDYRNAGLIFHHSRIKNEYCRSMAVKFLRKSAELDGYESLGIKWLLAATIDRQLQEQKKAQIYGTQYIQNESGKYELYDLDPNQISDEERKLYAVPIVEAQADEVAKMNKKQLHELFLEKKSIPDLIKFCLVNKNNKDYNLSWQGMSQFAFHLKRLNKLAEAQQFFELAIEFYPNEYDLYHSLGLLFEEMDRKEDAVKMLEKSVALNPKFFDGINDLKRLKN